MAFASIAGRKSAYWRYPRFRICSLMITLLDEHDPSWFPNLEELDDQGLVAVSEKLGPERIVVAYCLGIFPWMKMDYSPNFWCWFSPNPRMVLDPHQFKVSKSLRRVIRSEKFEIKINSDFPGTMRACASITRSNQDRSWIEDEMIRDYTILHEMGIAHSIEAYEDEKLVGGLYGLAMGKMFFGESMFHRVSNASKVCVAHLSSLSQKGGISLIDCQAHTPHLESLGAVEIPRTQYLERLKSLVDRRASVIDWQSIH